MFHLMTLADITPGVFHELLATAQDIRRHPPVFKDACAGRVVAMVSYGTSFHLQLPMEIAARALGGQIQVYSQADLGERWATAPGDLATLLSASVDGIALIAPQEVVQAFGLLSSVPIISVCAGQHSPVDALSMLYTVQRAKGSLSGKRIAVVGDGASVANGALLAGAVAGMTVAIAHPRGYAPDPEVTTIARHLAAQTGGAVLVTEDPVAAVSDADVIVVDAWSSPGGGREPQRRVHHFSGYALTSELLSLARPGAMVLHQGPVRIPGEMTAEVAAAHSDSSWDWAGNRIHVCKAVLLHALGRNA